MSVSNSLKVLNSYGILINISFAAAAISFIEIIFQFFFICCLKRHLSPVHYSDLNFTDFLPVLFFGKLAIRVPTATKKKKKEIKTLKTKESKLSIPTKLHAPIKNIDPDRIKLAM